MPGVVGWMDPLTAPPTTVDKISSSAESIFCYEARFDSTGRGILWMDYGAKHQRCNFIHPMGKAMNVLWNDCHVTTETEIWLSDNFDRICEKAGTEWYW